jgi:predicted alpha/beta-hydrolase family hydrolase
MTPRRRGGAKGGEGAAPAADDAAPAPPLLFDGPALAPATVVLAHGAGSPMESPGMRALARGLAGRGLRVVRFEFPDMRRRREGGARGGPPDRSPVLEATWLAVIAALGGGSGLVIGGRSMGGRIASHVADRAGARGLVCLGYPFHPPGQLHKLRTAHLASLRTPTLIVQGTRDPFGGPDEVAGYELSAAIRVFWVDGGDHSVTAARAVPEVVAFIAGLLPVAG